MTLRENKFTCDATRCEKTTLTFATPNASRTFHKMGKMSAVRGSSACTCQHQRQTWQVTHLSLS